MAIIADATKRREKKKNFKSGYVEVLGNIELSNLITDIHSTKISNGTQLELILESKIKESLLIKDLDAFLKTDNHKSGVYLVNKQTLKKSKKFEGRIWVDFLIIEISNSKKMCYIIELKSGSVLDTGKSESERYKLGKFQDMLSKKVTYETSIFIVSFHEKEKDIIKKGFKNKFNINEIMTGIEMCQLLGINYEEVLLIFEKEQKENETYVLNKMKQILLDNY